MRLDLYVSNVSKLKVTGFAKLIHMLFHAEFLVKVNPKIPNLFTWANVRLTDCY